MPSLTRFEPRSLGDLIAAGENPTDYLDEIRSLPKAPIHARLNAEGTSAESLADILTGCHPNMTAEDYRRDAEWMTTHQHTGLPDTIDGTPSDFEHSPRGFAYVVTSTLWAAEILEDPSLIERALMAGGEPARQAWDEIMAMLSGPNPDGADRWDELTRDEMVEVNLFVEQLIALRS